MAACVLDVRPFVSKDKPFDEISVQMHSCIEQAAQCVISGGLVIFPTETFYGIAASVECPEALQRLFRIKGRQDTKPIGLIAGQRRDVDRVMHVAPILEPALNLFWPGPLTLVAPPKHDLPTQLTSGPLDVAGIQYPRAVGVRVSSHPIASLLAKQSGGLITATSANFSGQPAPTSLVQLNPLLQEQVDMVLDAGKLVGQMPSTLIRLLTDRLMILRQGAITAAQLRAALPEMLVFSS